MAVTQRDLTIDFLRVVCILYIVGYWHLVPYTQSYPGYANFVTEAIKDSALGVFVFCSGYLLALREVSLTPAGLWTFYRRRLLRIYPLYALALLLFAPLGLAGPADLPHALLLISMFLPPAPYTLWFITMIMAFYLIAPLLIRLAGHAGVYLFAVALLLVAIIGYHLQVHATDTRMLMFLPAFAFGVLFARHAALRDLLRRYRIGLVPILIGAYLLFAQQHGATLESALGRIPLVLAGTAVAFLYAGPVARMFPAPGMLWLSYASFGLYLFHRVVYALVIDAYFPAQGLTRLLYLLGVALPLSIVTAYGVQKIYDRGLDWAEARFAQTRAPR